MAKLTGPMRAVINAITSNGGFITLADIKAKKVLQGTDEDPFRWPIDMRTINAMLKRGVLVNNNGTLTVG